ncbi:response regulator [Paenibacillus rhizovicinus]|uniref:histidine kinase n=1 Tax=Paenibacillus rhizovicinus TaxID=2704463 RepID=A0A6C0NT81_9BACL|nr:histidine kinase [Paenibacillus rhizovicinus]QHW29419.1 response regulator [Paenibacillus rhizovicinus]
MNDSMIDASDRLQLMADDDADDETVLYWKFLIVDDDPDIHTVTKLVLEGHTFEDGKLQFFSAYSAVEAILLLERHPDIAVVLLDVVMEEDDAGLKLVKRVREQMGNRLVRIILRTGQPGQAPEHTVIRSYDISDYKEKTELTSTKLFSTVYTSIRTYRYLNSIAAAHDTLERRVRERTQELEERARDLHASMRHTYEAMMEVSVLEERNRIARDIHNVVGHTLTAAVVQLEAGKHLINLDTERASEKMDLASQLVRKGLDEIRSSVHQLADERETVDLQRDLARLVRETEAHAGVCIHCEIEPMPKLSFFQIKLLCHALQEGLTNGIRHGRSTRFHFRLAYASGDRRIAFALRNNGLVPRALAFGFGLGALRDQVELAHGSLCLEPVPHEGMELRIIFPIAGAVTGSELLP